MGVLEHIDDVSKFKYFDNNINNVKGFYMYFIS